MAIKNEGVSHPTLDLVQEVLDRVGDDAIYAEIAGLSRGNLPLIKKPVFYSKSRRVLTLDAEFGDTVYIMHAWFRMDIIVIADDGLRSAAIIRYLKARIKRVSKKIIEQQLRLSDWSDLKALGGGMGTNPQVVFEGWILPEDLDPVTHRDQLTHLVTKRTHPEGFGDRFDRVLSDQALYERLGIDDAIEEVRQAEENALSTLSGDFFDYDDPRTKLLAFMTHLEGAITGQPYYMTLFAMLVTDEDRDLIREDDELSSRLDLIKSTLVTTVEGGKIKDFRPIARLRQQDFEIYNLVDNLSALTGVQYYAAPLPGLSEVSRRVPSYCSVVNVHEGRLSIDIEWIHRIGRSMTGSAISKCYRDLLATTNPAMLEAFERYDIRWVDHIDLTGVDTPLILEIN